MNNRQLVIELKTRTQSMLDKLYRNIYSRPRQTVARPSGVRRKPLSVDPGAQANIRRQAPVHIFQYPND